jgi:membrane protein implicated in regulation of membrane protease activity
MFFGLTGELIIVIIILILGLIIIAVLRALLFLLPAAIVAVVIWFLTGNLTWAAVAFLIIAALSILKRH